MMQNGIDAILNDLLTSWHRWALGYKHATDIGSSAMFRNARPSRGYDTVSDIVDSEIDGGQMEAINFHVMELTPIHRTALQIQARNLHTGHSVWRSPRLPEDAEERTVVLMEARNLLLKRLLAAGVV